MTRRRIIFVSLAALSAAFVVAVQRDTFVRRWCLPAPPPEPRRDGVLSQVIETFPLDGLTRQEAIARLAGCTNARIVIDLTHGAIVNSSIGPLYGCVRHATVEQILWRILAGSFDVTGEKPLVEESKGLITQGTSPDRPPPTSVRVYDLMAALAPEGSRVPMSEELICLRFTWFGTAPADPLENVTASIQIMACFHLKSQGTLSSDIDPVARFGSRLVVVTDRRAHWTISELLREEAEARRAAPATLPAQP